MILTAWVPTMSLFHDIKLKRRKVDTHCNSDGEIGADVNTSSPESLTTDNHVKDLDTGSASGASTTQTYLSEDGVSSLGSGSPPQLEVMCSDTSATRSDRDTSPPPEAPSKCKVRSPDSEHVVNGIVESPQHERRNSVFDGGGERNEGPEGLDLSRNKRDSSDRSSTSPSSFEEHNMSILRLVNASYKPPLVMGDISSNGPGKTMMWSSSPNERMYDSTNSLSTNVVDSMKQVNAASPTKLSPISGNNHACSPLSQQLSLVPVTSAGSPVSPVFHSPLYNNNNTQTKSVLSRALTSYNPCINGRGESLLGYVPSSSRAPYHRRDNSPVGFTRYWPSNGLTNGESKPMGNIASSSPPGHLTDSQALNLTVCSPVVRKTEVPIAPSSSVTHTGEDEDEDDQPMVCMICEDKATGLHYGIITCEGCKGFFKRTVQNKRVYTCVADGNCEITKAQRNRCQYCRFQKCLRQGMVLAAVREDRMPGGRNSGAVYNLYKVKYKKHKKGQKNGQIRHEPLKITNTNNNHTNGHHMRYPVNGPQWTNGQILKAALTSPCDILQLRHTLESWVNSSRDRQMTPEQAMAIISQLIECDDFEEIATVKNLDELKEAKAELSDKLCQIGDNIVYKLVQWTKRLPFYLELPVTVHTQLLSHKWHELLVLTTSAYLAIRSTNNNQKNNNNNGQPQNTSLYNGMATTNGGTPMSPDDELQHEVGVGLCILHSILGAMVDGAISLEQLRVEAGHLVEQLTQLSTTFRKLQLCLEEYVCLKVVAMLNQEGYHGQREIEMIQERYLTALRVFVENRFPQQSSRLSDLLSRLPEIQSAGELLLHTKMFFVPLFLNTNYVR